MARPLIEFVFAQHLPWQPGFPGAAAGRAAGGVSAKVLSRDAATGACSVIARYPHGWTSPLGATCAAAEEAFILDGTLTIGGAAHGRDTYLDLPAGTPRPAMRSDEGFVAITFFDRTPVFGAAQSSSEPMRIIDAMTMRWDASVADPSLAWMGNRRKVLKWDTAHDQKATFLLSVPPHIYPDNWACPTLTHPCVEEAFQLAGDTIGPHGRMTPGAYFWRPEGIAHGPFGSREGSLSLIRFVGGKHINIWDDHDVPYRYDFPYAPKLPDEMRAFAHIYEGSARY